MTSFAKQAFSFACLIVIMSHLAAAVSDDALKTEALLKSAESDMQKMLQAGIPISRYNDTLLAARQMYEAQNALENASGKFDYSIVMSKIDELGELKQNAYRAADEITALEEAINQTKGIDTKPVFEIYKIAKEDYASERYEESLKQIDLAYKKISELDALDTKVKAIYEATSKTIMGFIRDNWKAIAASLAAIIIATLLAYNRVMYYITEKKIRDLEKRRESIKKLIAKTQRDYFELNTLNETNYYIRTKKYGELIRDINRQIPLLKEELAKKGKNKMLA